MSGHVLIVDSQAPRRAARRGALTAAQFEVTQGADPATAPALAAAVAPDLLILDLADAATGLAALRQVRDRPGPELPVIALCPPGRPGGRLAALRAGADEAMDHGTPDLLIQARIRSLLRARDAALDLRDDDEPAGARHGLAEAPAAFSGRGAAAVVAVLPSCGATPTTPLPDPLAALPHAVGCALRRVAAAGEVGRGAAPDLVVIDAGAAATPGAEAEALRLLADLRARAATRQAATMLLLPSGATGAAAMAFDLGAGDVLTDAMGADEVAARVRALIGRKARADRLQARIQARLRAAVRDPLTGLYNRRHAEPQLARIAERARATGRDLAVMILDLDHFKAVNDTWGHAAGDRVLAEVARRLQGAARPQDLVARIGGEEFLVAMPDATAEQARAGAERLRAAIESEPFPVEPACARGQDDRGWGAARAFGKSRPADPARAAQEARLTVSIGVALGPRGPRGVPDLFEQADAALYAAKTAGRNLVAMALGAA